MSPCIPSVACFCQQGFYTIQNIWGGKEREEGEGGGGEGGAEKGRGKGEIWHATGIVRIYMHAICT